MGEESTRGHNADRSGWVTTRVAAQALHVDPRTVRKYIKQGKLEAKVEGEGVEKAYLVSIDSVYTLRGSRESERHDPRSTRDESPRESGGSAVSEDLVDLVRDLTREVSRRSSEAAELRTRLELTERADSSQREALEQRLQTEQLRREQAEHERDELAEQLAALQEQRESAETVPDAVDEAQPRSATEGTQEESSRRSWLYRLFFGPD